MDHVHGHDALLSGLGGAFDALGLPAALFVAGLVGGLTHCVGMCGPFVLAQVGAGMQADGNAAYGEWSRLRGAALVPYHLGRATTYTALGAVAGAVGSALVQLTEFHWILGVFLALAASLFVVQTMPILSAWLPRLPGGAGRVGIALSHATQGLFRNPRGFKGYALGVSLGFLPCGLLYGALAAAAGSGRPALGAVGMAFFVLGTVPSLVGVGYLGAYFGRRWQRAMRIVVVPLMLLNAAGLGVLAVRALS
jgi:sulfite exporter TauE/SafE